MARMWAVVGDATSGGGQVVTGSPFTDIDGKPVARVNDTATCLTHKGTFPIVDGDPTTVIDGQAVASHGSSLACGCKVLAVQQMRVFLDNGSTVSATQLGTPLEKPFGAPFAAPLNDSTDTAKKVLSLSWSYGPEMVALATSSRHYSDLNLHVKTENYSPGDLVKISVRIADYGESCILSCNATVDATGEGTVMSVFDGQHLPLFARK